MGPVMEQNDRLAACRHLFPVCSSPEAHADMLASLIGLEEGHQGFFQLFMLACQASTSSTLASREKAWLWQ